MLSAGDLASGGRGASFAPLPKGCGVTEKWNTAAVCRGGVAGETRSCPGGEWWGRAVMRSISAYGNENSEKVKSGSKVSWRRKPEGHFASSRRLGQRGRGAPFAPLPKVCGMVGNGIRQLCVMEA